MPNWCYNYLSMEGSAKDISAVKAQLNASFTREHENWDMETKSMQVKEYTYSNPIFAFWNIIKPTDLEAYNKQPDQKEQLKEIQSGEMFAGNDWYSWNVRNWGTKWDVGVSDDEKYPETELTDEGKKSLSYRFNTAWSPPAEAITKLSEQYPDLVITLSFEEETGWGGEIIFENGEGVETESYGWKCRECDNTEEETPYCEECDFDTCPSCGYNEADEACEQHREGHNAHLLA